MLVAPKTPKGKTAPAPRQPVPEQHAQQQKKLNKSHAIIKSYDVKRFMNLTYTGGRVAKAFNDKFFVCCAGKVANVIDYENGQVLAELEADEFIISIALSPDDRKLAVSCRSLNTIIWSLATKRELRVVRGAHPVLEMSYDPTGTLLAMGCSDGSVKVYDSNNHYFTHHFAKVHTGKIQLVKFHPSSGNLHLFTSALDGLKVWDLTTRKCVATLTHHSSVVTDIEFTKDFKTMISASRDNVLVAYDATNNFAHKKMIPVFESVESVSRLEGDLTFTTSDSQQTYSAAKNTLLLTAGEKGILRVYDVESGECVFTQPDDELRKSFTQMIIWKEHNQAMCVSSDGNFLFYDLQTLVRQKQILGFNDEVLDLKFVGKSSPMVACATNSENVVVFNTETKNTNFLSGHTDIVLSVDASRDARFLVSSSKDQTIRVWDLHKMRCVAVGTSHTSHVTAVAFAPKHFEYIASCSNDKTLKIWSMEAIKNFASATAKKNKGEALDEKDVLSIAPAKTCVAHAKEISNVAISPDEQLIATCSADRFAKVWSVDNLECVHSFQHKMGVWSVAFSPIEKCVVTSSSDNLIRIWSLKTGACLKVFEGHEQAVLKVSFINVGTQLISSAADGLVKLWTVKTGECVETFDVHTDRVWGLGIKNDGAEIITGGEDSKINYWKENTQEVLEEQKKQLDDSIIKDQKLQNLVRENKYLEAIVLAISMDKPRQVYALIQKLLETSQKSALDPIIAKLSFNETMSLFQYAVDWNTNSRFSGIAQLVLNAMFNSLEPNFIPWSYEKSVDSLLSYGARHFKRVESLIQQSYIIDFALNNMKISTMDRPGFSASASIAATLEDAAPTTRKQLQDPELVAVVKPETEQIQMKIIQGAIANAADSQEKPKSTPAAAVPKTPAKKQSKAESAVEVPQQAEKQHTEQDGALAVEVQTPRKGKATVPKTPAKKQSKAESAAEVPQQAEKQHTEQDGAPAVEIQTPRKGKAATQQTPKQMKTPKTPKQRLSSQVSPSPAKQKKMKTQ